MKRLTLFLPSHSGADWNKYSSGNIKQCFQCLHYASHLISFYCSPGDGGCRLTVKLEAQEIFWK